MTEYLLGLASGVLLGAVARDTLLLVRALRRLGRS